MALPRAIQEQIDGADALVAQINGNQTEVNPSDTVPPTDSPQAAPEPPPTPISQGTEPKQVSEETWEQKYRTLRGMFDAEVPRLHAQSREMNQQIQTLIAENAVAKAQQTRETAPASAKTLITEQDKEAFGSDLLDLIDRATESKISGYRDTESQLRSEINELKGKLGNVSDRQVVSDKDRYQAQLSSKVPEWESLNTDAGFLNWLAEVDPVYGLPRQYALNNAYESLDADRTATIFAQYKATVAPVRSNNRADLQRQVAPTRSRASATPEASANGQRIFTQAEITDFYSEWVKGRLDTDEAVRFEKEINAAISEGRIR